LKIKSQKGFTLIELLVVVAIIAILALIVLLALNPVEMARRSRDSRRLSDLGTLRRAIDLSLADGEALPIIADMTVDTNVDVTNFGGSMDIGKYLSVAPQDPVNDGSGDLIQTTTGVCPDGKAQVAKNAMNYKFNSNGDVYVLSTRLESTDNCGVPSGDINVNL